MALFPSIRNRLRSTAWIYRALVVVRDCFIPAVRDGFWECYRSISWRAFHFLYSTTALQKKSSLYAWISSVRNGPPFKLFSVYQALRCGWPEIQGRIVIEDQGAPVVRKGSLLAEGTLEHHTDQPWPVSWSRHADAHLVSKSLALVSAKKELCVESVYGYRFFRGDPATQYWRLPPPVEFKGNWTSIVSRWVPNHSVPNHSHWLLEALPRLALLPEFPADTRIIVPGKLAAYQRESLAMLGLTGDRLRFSPETHLQVENYYFSSPPSQIVCYSPYAVKFLRDSFLAKADFAYSGPKRFFVRRTNNPRDMSNSLEVERFFTGLGWATVDPSELTFAQEIRLFAEAEAVCGMLGSGTTNTVFCRPDCAVVAVATDYFNDGVLDWILQVNQIKKYNVHIYPADGFRRFRVSLDQLKRQLESVGLLP